MSNSRKQKPSFVARNLVTIVMIPSLIAIHAGWSFMQQNRALVTAEEQIDLPVVTFAKFCWRRLQGLDSGTSGSSTVTSAVNVVPAPTAAVK